MLSGLKNLIIKLNLTHYNVKNKGISSNNVINILYIFFSVVSYLINSIKYKNAKITIWFSLKLKDKEKMISLKQSIVVIKYLTSAWSLRRNQVTKINTIPVKRGRQITLSYATSIPPTAPSKASCCWCWTWLWGGSSNDTHSANPSSTRRWLRNTTDWKII